MCVLMFIRKWSLVAELRLNSPAHDTVWRYWHEFLTLLSLMELNLWASEIFLWIKPPVSWFSCDVTFTNHPNLFTGSSVQMKGTESNFVRAVILIVVSKFCDVLTEFVSSLVAAFCINVKTQKDLEGLFSDVSECQLLYSFKWSLLFLPVG